LRTPVQLAHAAAAVCDELDPLPAPARPPPIDSAAAVGDAVVIVANQGVFAAANFVFIDDVNRSELRRIGALNDFALEPGAGSDANT
jgi:hypothetical protein